MDSFSIQPLLDRLTHLATRSGALTRFSALATPLDKIQYCLEAQLTCGDVTVTVKREVRQLLEALLDRCGDHGKSEPLATTTKEKGSKAYLRKRDGEALALFTTCLREAPQQSPVAALAYANRSAVLYQMHKYQECLQDIARAEKSGYPSTNLHKLLVRRCSAYHGMRDRAKFQAALDHCKKHLPQVPVEAREKFKKNIDELEEKAVNPDEAGRYTSAAEVASPALLAGENHSVKYMSDALEMKVTEELGRHIVSRSEVGKGSVVFVERPYAAILLPEYHHTHCQTCFTPSINPVPCHECRDVVFCSEECRSAGHAFHQYECGLMHILSSVGIAHLAARVLYVTGWNLYCQIKSEGVEGGVSGVGEGGVYNGRDPSEGYRAVYHLLPHYDNCLPEDQLQYCVAAILLAMVTLERTKFAKHSADGQKDAAPLDVAHLAVAIKRHIAQLVSNAHAITQVTSTESSGCIQQVRQARIASAIYPTASLMNHSCKPNIINSFYKDVLVIRAIEDIKTGSQVFNCYGPHYCRQPREERQQALKQQYFFRCRCDPCINPLYLQKEAGWGGFQCVSCGGVATWTGEDRSGFGVTEEGVLLCLECHQLARPPQHFVDTCTQVNALHEEAEEALSRGQCNRAISALRQALAVGARVYLPQNQYFLSLRDALAKALGESGDYGVCCQELRRCLEVTEARYGPDSIEVGHELLKMSDALTLAAPTHRRYQEELLAVKQRTDNIFSLNYGPNWQKYLGTDMG